MTSFERYNEWFGDGVMQLAQAGTYVGGRSKKGQMGMLTDLWLPFFVVGRQLLYC